MYKVLVNKSVLKRIRKAPRSVRFLFDELIEDLEGKGPVQNKWPNYSKLDGPNWTG